LEVALPQELPHIVLQDRWVATIWMADHDIAQSNVMIIWRWDCATDAD
jgi:hypothetical protein